MRIGGSPFGRALAGLAVLILCGCTAEGGGDPVADTSRVTVAPEPAPPDPAAPDPAAPDPAAPDPAAPDPAAPDPAAPRADAVEEPMLTEAAQEATVTVSPVAVACADVVAAMTDAVISYETVALAEDGGGGNRTAAAAEMRAAWDRARAAANRDGGLAAAAAPALVALTALHDGLGTRETLDASDAGPWRTARESLQNWCRARA